MLTSAFKYNVSPKHCISDYEICANRELKHTVKCATLGMKHMEC